jgi:DNA-directed RNA polymerase subunit RPC12/RpoP
MIIGKILENDKKIELTVEIHCTNCGKQVPGGLKTGEKFSKTDEFKIELEEFMKNYLCGICRDKKRTKKLKN